jgi:hypothetical protein
LWRVKVRHLAASVRIRTTSEFQPQASFSNSLSPTIKASRTTIGARLPPSHAVPHLSNTRQDHARKNDDGAQRRTHTTMGAMPPPHYNGARCHVHTGRGVASTRRHRTTPRPHNNGARHRAITTTGHDTAPSRRRGTTPRPHDDGARRRAHTTMGHDATPSRRRGTTPRPRPRGTTPCPHDDGARRCALTTTGHDTAPTRRRGTTPCPHDHGARHRPSGARACKYLPSPCPGPLTFSPASSLPHWAG